LSIEAAGEIGRWSIIAWGILGGTIAAVTHGVVFDAGARHRHARCARVGATPARHAVAGEAYP